MFTSFTVQAMHALSESKAVLLWYPVLHLQPTLLYGLLFAAIQSMQVPLVKQPIHSARHCEQDPAVDRMPVARYPALQVQPISAEGLAFGSTQVRQRFAWLQVLHSA